MAASGLRAQELANKVIPGAGFVLSGLILLGGLAFNTGNLGGAGLGLNVLTGLSAEAGAVISAAIALFIFVRKDSMRWMDVFTKVLGILMIVLTVYVVVVAEPPWGEALQKSVVPDKIDLLAIITLVGGTVGGYISFAGAHRLIDAGMTGTLHTKAVGKSAVTAILLASVMRVLLFLAALGVVAKGLSLNAENPAASVFQLAAGRIGYLLFGIVMWSAAITSVVGSAYTTVSFFRSLHPLVEKKEKELLAGFVVVALLIFLVVGKPVKTLVMVGALNGFILPVALIIILIAASNKKITGDYKHPLWLKIVGVAVTAFTLYLSVKTALTVF